MKKDAGFTYKVRNDLMSPELEIIAVEIMRCKAKPFIVISWYRPPDTEVKKFDNLECILDQIECENKDVILMVYEFQYLFFQKILKFE